MDTLATIKAILNDRLDIDPESVTETSTFASLGIDSLDMAQLVAYVDGLR